jgi:hypothetical protein
MNETDNHENASDETAILDLLSQRLKQGRRTYGPWRVTDGRRYPREALAEVLDALHYCAAELLRLERAEAAHAVANGELAEAEQRAHRARWILTECEREAAALREELHHARAVALPEHLGEALDWIGAFVRTARFELAIAERALAALRDRFKALGIPETGSRTKSRPKRSQIVSRRSRKSRRQS